MSEEEAGQLGSSLVSANTDENHELQLLGVKGSVLSVWEGEERYEEEQTVLCALGAFWAASN